MTRRARKTFVELVEKELAGREDLSAALWEALLDRARLFDWKRRR